MTSKLTIMNVIDSQKKIASINLRNGIVLITATVINSYSYSEMIIGSVERVMTIFFVVSARVIRRG